jgi:hypothetical protein
VLELRAQRKLVRRRPCRRALDRRFREYSLNKLFPSFLLQIDDELGFDLVKRWRGGGTGFDQFDDMPAVGGLHGLLGVLAGFQAADRSRRGRWRARSVGGASVLLPSLVAVCTCSGRWSKHRFALQNR